MSLLLSLPEELLLNCVAWVPRLYYPTLSLVSKRFQSLIASPELDKTRSLLGITESCLYVRLNMDDSYRIFTLSWKPDKTDDYSSSGYVLATIPIPHSWCTVPSSLVAVGSNIYNIKESDSPVPSCTSVSILDCRSHTWLEGPILQEDFSSILATVVDQKIYVMGLEFKNRMAVFNTKTQSWDRMPRETQGKKYICSACIDGKLHVVTDRGYIAYNSKQGRWDEIEIGDDKNNIMFCSHTCLEIEKVLYFVTEGKFGWYDKEVRMWRNLKGLVGLPELSNGSDVRCFEYGGKMMILWEKNGPYCRVSRLVKEKMIWLAEISLEKRGSCEIWGIVEWFQHVLTVPYPCSLVDVAVATV